MKTSWWDTPKDIKSISKKSEFINRIKKLNINNLYLKYDFNKFKTEANNNTNLSFVINRQLYELTIEIIYILFVLFTLKIIIYNSISSNSKFIKHKDYTYFNLARINNKLKYIKLITPAITIKKKSKKKKNYFDEEQEDDIDIFNNYSDPLIYDSITGYIFEKLNKKYNDNFNSSYLVKYDYSFVSICNVKNDKEKTTYWDYNELSNILLTNDKKKLEQYNNICWIIVYDAVKGECKSVSDIFKSLIINPNKNKVNTIIINIINKISKLNDFLVFIGLKYGYLHNDLYLGNILYDDTNNNIKLIDYGRNFFGYFYNNRDDEIDNYCKGLYNYLLMSDFRDFGGYYNDIKINTYKDLYTNKFNFCKSQLVNENGNYPSIILDLMTLGLNVYYNLKMILITNYGITHNIYEHIINNYCEKILIFTETNIDKLINYKTKITLNNEIIKYYMDNNKNKNKTLDRLVEIYISLKEQNKEDENEMIEFKEIIDYLLDILFYTGILIISFNDIKPFDLDNNYLFYQLFQFVKFHKDCNTEIDYLYKSILYLNENHLNLKKYNIYFKQLNNNSLSLSKIIQGGNNKTKLNEISDKKILSNYKKIFKEKH